MTKEQVYDEKISTLMAQIIGICEANHIAMIASFALPTEEDPNLLCTTCLPDENGTAPISYRLSRKLIVGD